MIHTGRDDRESVPAEGGLGGGADGGGLLSVPFDAIGQWPAAIEHVRQLSRAGVPLPAALRQAAGQTSDSKTSRSLGEIAERVEQGQPLAAAIDGLGLPMERPLRAMLEAGTKTGDLWAVLTPLVATAAESQRLVRAYRRLLAYYGLCFALGAMLCVLAIRHGQPALRDAVAEVRSPASPMVVSGVERTRDAAPATGGHSPQRAVPAASAAPIDRVSPLAWSLLAVPVATFVVVLVDAVTRDRRTNPLPLSGLPPMRGVARSLEWFRWTAVLEAMLTRKVPAADAIRLAGETAAWRRLRDESVELSQRVERGGRFDAAVAEWTTAPLLLRSLLAPDPRLRTSRDTAAVDSTLPNQSATIDLPSAFGHAARFFHQTARLRLSRFGRSLRLVATLLFGCGLLGYGMLLVESLNRAFQQLAAPL